VADTPLTLYRRQLAELLKSIDQGNADLQSLHADLSRRIIAELRKQGASNTNALKLQKQFDREFEKLLPKRVRIVRERIEEGAKAGRRASQQTVRVTLGDKVETAHVRATAGSLREASERIAGRVTVDGKSLGKRMRGMDKEVAAEMAREVQNGIQQRNGILGAARKIEKLDPRDAHLPKYLQQLEQAARRGSIDEVKALAASYSKRIAQLGEIQTDGTFKASKYSLRSATQKFVQKVQTASADGIDTLVKKYVEDKLAWRANTIARSETVEAMRQSYVAQSKNKPGVVCFQWRLSNRHEGHDHRGAKQDVCDILAHQNAYGLGPGRYPKDKVPHLPHPNCLCATIAVFDDKHFERAENDQGQVPAEMKDAQSPGAIGWLQQNPAAAARILGPTRYNLLKQGVNVLDESGRPRLVRDLLKPRTVPQVQKLAVGSPYVPDAVGSRITAPTKADGPVASGQKPPKGPHTPHMEKVSLPKTPVANASPPPKKPIEPSTAKPRTRLPADGLKIPRERSAEINKARREARASIKKHGIRLGKKGYGTPAPQSVDLAIQDAGLQAAHRAWTGEGPTGRGWYRYTTPANAYPGGWLIAEAPESELAILAEQVGYKGAPADLARMARAHYAATQEVLAERLRTTGIPGVDERGYVTLYRGVKAPQAHPMRAAFANGDEVDFDVRPLSSWTTDRQVARGFASDDGAVIRQEIHVSRVFAQWEQADFSSRVYGGEEEWVLAYPERVIRLRVGDLED
jgi:hypothetical protein